MKTVKLRYPISYLFVAAILCSCKKEPLLKYHKKESLISRQSKDSLDASVEILSITDAKEDPALLKFVNKQKEEQLQILFKTPGHHE